MEMAKENATMKAQLDAINNPSAAAKELITKPNDVDAARS